MSTRRFDNFLKAYIEYADDSFVPPQFHIWSALSILAGALERKVWLPWTDTYSFFPNIYVLLVSMPGDGKSMALNRAVGLLQDVNKKTNSMNILPNQVTEAKFIELMGQGKAFIDKAGEKELIYKQNSGYYFASEASNSLKNIFGDFIACLTDFYDCPPTWERATKKDGRKIQLHNVCMNMLAGSTFDYLSKLVNDENIMGGFASRMIYVVSKNKEVKKQLFQHGGMTDQEKMERQEYRQALLDDLSSIHKMTGAMNATQEFKEAWQAWYPEFETKRREMSSEKLQSLFARANTNLLKVSILLSVADSDSKELRLEHWEKAKELVLPIYESLPALFVQARATSSNKGQNTGSVLSHLLMTSPPLTKEQLSSKAVFANVNHNAIDKFIEAYISLGKISVGIDGKLIVHGDLNEI